MVKPAKVFFEPDTYIILGHRGYPIKYPENTILGYKKAVEHGAMGLEIDVRLTRDGVPVIMHDHTINRTTNGTGLVSELTWDYLSTLDAGGWFDPSFAGREDCKIPLLSDVFKAFRGTGVVLELDFKESVDPIGLIDRVVDLIDTYDMSGQVFCLVDETHITYLRDKYPHVIAYHTSGGVFDVDTRIHKALIYGTPVISWSAGRINAKLRDRVQEIGRLLRASIVNDLSRIEEWIENGVNFFLTDYIEDVATALAANGINQKIEPPTLRRAKRTLV